MAFNPVASYTRWLHTQWPSGTVERAPVAQPDGRTNVPGLFIVGDLTGVPLLKFSADTGTRAVMTIDAEPSFKDRDTSDQAVVCLLYTSPSPRDLSTSRMPSSA